MTLHNPDEILSKCRIRWLCKKIFTSSLTRSPCNWPEHDPSDYFLFLVLSLVWTYHPIEISIHLGEFGQGKDTPPEIIWVLPSFTSTRWLARLSLSLSLAVCPSLWNRWTYNILIQCLNRKHFESALSVSLALNDVEADL